MLILENLDNLNKNQLIACLQNFLGYCDTPNGEKRFPELQPCVKFVKEELIKAEKDLFLSKKEKLANSIAADKETLMNRGGPALIRAIDGLIASAPNDLVDFLKDSVLVDSVVKIRSMFGVGLLEALYMVRSIRYNNEVF